MVMYDDKCVNWICNRQKSETRILFNPNRRPGIPGTIHWIKKDRGGCDGHSASWYTKSWDS